MRPTPCAPGGPSQASSERPAAPGDGAGTIQYERYRQTERNERTGRLARAPGSVYMSKNSSITSTWFPCMSTPSSRLRPSSAAAVKFALPTYAATPSTVMTFRCGKGPPSIVSSNVKRAGSPLFRTEWWREAMDACARFPCAGRISSIATCLNVAATMLPTR